MKELERFLSKNEIIFELNERIKEEKKINTHFLEDTEESLRFMLGLILHESEGIKLKKVKEYINEKGIDHQYINFDQM